MTPKSKSRSKSSFSSLDAAADGLLRRMARGDNALAWLQARWGRIVGEPLSRKIEPVSLHGRRLTVSLLDPAWQRPVEAALAELERKLSDELPAIRPKVTLRGEVRSRGSGVEGRDPGRHDSGPTTVFSSGLGPPDA